MDDLLKGQEHYPFIKLAQYLAGLTTHQDAWAEVGNALLSFFGADLVAFGERRADGEITAHHWTFSDQAFGEALSSAVEPHRRADAAQSEVGSEIRKTIDETLTSGFLTSRLVVTPDPLSIAFLPLVQENQTAAVMLVGHRTSAPFPRELLDVYLAVAGLVGTTIARLSSERALRRHRRELEALVEERTGELAESNEQFQREIDQRKRAEERTEHLNRVLRAINNVNQLIVREKDRDRLLQGACDMLIETRGYHNAWIALFDEEGARHGAVEGLVTAAEAGLGEAFAPMASRLERGALPACGRRALAQTGVVVTRDPPVACTDCPLAASYAGRGGMAVRLAHGERVYGLLTVSIPAHLTEDEDEQALLREVGQDIAFALHRMALEEARTRAERALRKSERILNATGKMGKIGGWEHDLTTGEAVWTQALHDIIGIPYDQEPPGVDKHLSYYPSPDREILEEAYSRAVEERTPFDLELQVHTAQRELIWCRAQGEPVVENGECVAVRGTFQDISERKELTSLLRQERDLLKAVMDTSPVCITMVDREGRLIFANDRAEEVLGLEKETITSRTYDDPAWRITDYEGGPFPSEQLPFRQVVRTGEAVQDVRHAIEWPDGRRVLLSIDGVPLFDASGALERVVFAIEDVTDQMRAVERLEESKERYRTLVERQGEGIGIVDTEERFIFANPAAHDIFGVEQGGLVGRSLEAFLDEGTFKDIRAQTEVRKEGEQSTYEMSITQPDGQERVLLVTATPQYDDDGWFIGTFGIFRDITARKRAEEALQEYRERLEEMVEERTQELLEARDRLLRQEKLAMLGQLAGSINHELRGPLGNIKNSAYFLNMVLDEPDEEVRETLELLELEVGRAEMIVRSLLSFVRTGEPQREAVDVNALLEETLPRVEIPERIEVIKQADEGAPTVSADSEQLRQVLRNLISNAVEAMPEGGRLTVQTSEVAPKPSRSRGVMVSIADTGEGIPEEHLERIFEPLFSTKAEGVGLGLALARMLVEAHGGTIEVESEVGEGSTFTVRLPVRRE